MKFKHRLKRLVLYLLLIFVALFAARLAYGFYAYPNSGVIDQATYYDDSEQFQSQQQYSKKNYASSTYKYKSGGESAPQEFDIDQKYEKIANLRSFTKKFSQDEEIIRAKVKEHNAIIQAEDNRGNEGNRSLLLIVGVQPDNFDVFCNEMKQIGKITSINISKVDKTNDFLGLKAKKNSLESTRKALLELKNKPGSVDEMLNLQDKIQQVENDLQNLGVQLGEFDELNSFCTVNLTLTEHHSITPEKISFAHRVGVALLWAVEVYLGLMAVIIFAGLAALILLLIVDKLKLMRKLLDKIDQ